MIWREVWPKRESQSHPSGLPCAPISMRMRKVARGTERREEGGPVPGRKARTMGLAGPLTLKVHPRHHASGQQQPQRAQPYFAPVL